MPSTKTFSCSLYLNGKLQRHYDITGAVTDVKVEDDLYDMLEYDHSYDVIDEGDEYNWVVFSYSRCLLPA